MSPPCVEMHAERISGQPAGRRRLPADLHSETEAILRDLAYVYHLTHHVKQAITQSARA